MGLERQREQLMTIQSKKYIIKAVFFKYLRILSNLLASPFPSTWICRVYCNLPSRMEYVHTYKAPDWAAAVVPGCFLGYMVYNLCHLLVSCSRLVCCLCVCLGECVLLSGIGFKAVAKNCQGKTTLFRIPSLVLLVR